MVVHCGLLIPPPAAILETRRPGEAAAPEASRPFFFFPSVVASEVKAVVWPSPRVQAGAGSRGELFARAHAPGPRACTRATRLRPSQVVYLCTCIFM